MHPRSTISHHELIASLSSVDPKKTCQAAEQLGACTTKHVLDHLDLPVTRANEMAVAKQLRKLGYTQSRPLIQGERLRVYSPPAA